MTASATFFAVLSNVMNFRYIQTLKKFIFKMSVQSSCFMHVVNYRI